MKIFATVLLGPGSEATAPDAIRSASPLVDGFVLIESGGGERALSAARAASLGQREIYEVPFCWLGDYGAARQFALERARSYGADYALTLDPDERLVLGPEFRARLEAYPKVEVWILADRDTGYFKERVIRTDTRAHWHGIVCEFLDGREVAGSVLPGHFWELPKDDGAERHRWERGVSACQKMIDSGDDCYRWRRHLGSCLMGIGRQAEALEQYQKALPQALNPDETAWMKYLICEQLVITGKPEEAREMAARGLADHGGFIPEFGWILCYTDYKAGRPQNASRWAQLVLNTPPDKTRIGFRGMLCKTGAKQVLADIHRPRTDDSFDPEDFAYRRTAFTENYRTLANALCETLAPQSVVDLGAGNGLLLDALMAQPSGVPGVLCGIEREAGAEETTPESVRGCILYGESFVGRSPDYRFDLACSVEVLEHLPEEQSDAAVRSICAHSRRWVYFSAAGPGQPGKGHVNCQPKPYWRRKFEAQGFRFAEAETGALVERIKGLQPCTWLPHNAMIFERKRDGSPQL